MGGRGGVGLGGGGGVNSEEGYGYSGYSVCKEVGGRAVSGSLLGKEGDSAGVREVHARGAEVSEEGGWRGGEGKQEAQWGQMRVEGGGEG